MDPKGSKYNEKGGPNTEHLTLGFTVLDGQVSLFQIRLWHLCGQFYNLNYIT